MVELNDFPSYLKAHLKNVKNNLRNTKKAQNSFELLLINIQRFKDLEVNIILDNKWTVETRHGKFEKCHYFKYNAENNKIELYNKDNECFLKIPKQFVRAMYP